MWKGRSAGCIWMAKDRNTVYFFKYLSGKLKNAVPQDRNTVVFILIEHFSRSLLTGRWSHFNQASTLIKLSEHSHQSVVAGSSDQLAVIEVLEGHSALKLPVLKLPDYRPHLFGYVRDAFPELESKVPGMAGFPGPRELNDAIAVPGLFQIDLLFRRDLKNISE